MALDFPSSPTNGQLYTYGNTTYVYSLSATSWKVYSVGSSAPIDRAIVCVVVIR